MLGLIVGTLQGLLCGIRYKRDSNFTSNTVRHAASEESATVPVYEDIELIEINMSPNVAYEQVHRISM